MTAEITVLELKELLDSGQPAVLVDCREPDEHEFCKIEGARLIPLSDFENQATKVLNREDPIFIHCHYGGRSLRACEFLEAQGYKKVANVTGGIDAWSVQVDPSVPRY